MNIAFRVDSSHTIGSGHVMRCLVLAEELRRRGAVIHFICRDYSGNIISAIENSHFRVSVLEHPKDEGFIKGDDYKSWLGVSQDFDAEQSLVALQDETIDWLVVDHYSLGCEWHATLRKQVDKICVIDDLANRKYDCDILIDVNYNTLPNERYVGKVPAACSLLLGPSYALIPQQYRFMREKLPVRGGKVQNLLIYFGGTDQHNMTQLCLDALRGSEFSNIRFDVVVGQMNPHVVTLERYAELEDRICLHANLKDLSSLIGEADLALGGSGVTTWERMTLGVPSIIVTIADNQKPTAGALSRDGYVTYLGHYSDVTEAEVKLAVREKIQNLTALAAEAEKIKLLVDGHGLFRTAEAICPTDFSRVTTHYVDDDKASADCLVRSEDKEKARGNAFRVFRFQLDYYPLGRVIFHDDNDYIGVSFEFDQLAYERGWNKKLLGVSIRSLLTKSVDIKSNGDKEERSIKWNKYLALPSAQDAPEEKSPELHSLKISVLSSHSSWINDHISNLVWDWLLDGHKISWVHDKNKLIPGKFCFYLGCEQVVGKAIRQLYEHNLVVHESDLPHGRGWSPLTWQILEGSTKIPIVLFEAATQVDAGPIYLKRSMEFRGYELLQELRDVQGSTTIAMCKQFVEESKVLVEQATPQSGDISFYEKRSTKDSKIDPAQSVESVMPLLRVADYEKYPVFFSYQGVEYKIKIEYL
ncbi:MAG: UDP-2,4-diacetamido-2,4,6-trideoxy-beta-L-altropyranose hydrolase [Chloroflexota bacterium]|nr:UDP-2,4-diacetamido-2,4,6-trideoxy-beta-L-altropyranose hydrolase [Chloroflexota bacterium]